MILAKTMCNTHFSPKLARDIQIEILTFGAGGLFVSIFPFDNGIFFHRLFLFEIPGFTDH